MLIPKPLNIPVVLGSSTFSLAFCIFFCTFCLVLWWLSWMAEDHPTPYWHLFCQNFCPPWLVYAFPWCSIAQVVSRQLGSDHKWLHGMVAELNHMSSLPFAGCLLPLKPASVWLPLLSVISFHDFMLNSPLNMLIACFHPSSSLSAQYFQLVLILFSFLMQRWSIIITHPIHWYTLEQNFSFQFSHVLLLTFPEEGSSKTPLQPEAIFIINPLNPSTFPLDLCVVGTCLL